jgi:ankyrin repeat protein
MKVKMVPNISRALRFSLMVLLIGVLQGVEVNSEDLKKVAQIRTKKGMTSLMFAAQAGDIDLVNKLIKSGADVNALTYLKHGPQMSALAYAVQSQYVDVINALLGVDANLNIPLGDGGNTFYPLDIACDTGSVDVVRLLLEKGATLELTPNGPLYRIVGKGDNLALVDVLIEHCTKKHLLPDENFASELLFEAICSRSSNVMALVEKLYNFAFTGSYTLKPHCISIIFNKNSSKDIQELLLFFEKKGLFKVNDHLSTGVTPLSYAAARGKQDLVEWLLNTKGANPNIRNADGYSAVHFCRNEAIKKMIKEKQSVSTKKVAGVSFVLASLLYGVIQASKTANHRKQTVALLKRIFVKSSNDVVMTKEEKALSNRISIDLCASCIGMLVGSFIVGSVKED